MLFCFIITWGLGYSQFADCIKHAQLVIDEIEKHHYQPRDIDDDFEEDLKEIFVKSLDPNGLIFTRNSVSQIKNYNASILEEINSGKEEFIALVNNVYRKDIQRIEYILSDMMCSDFQFNDSDSMVIKRNDPYVAEDLFRIRWHKYIKLMILRATVSQLDTLSDSRIPDNMKVCEIFDRVIKGELCRLTNKLEEQDGSFVGNKFVKAIASSFDPHTTYFTTAENKAFEYVLSKSAATYGFEVYINDAGNVEIYLVTPGSNAWKSNLVNEGDIILGLRRNDKYVDLLCTSLNNVVDLIQDIPK